MFPLQESLVVITWLNPIFSRGIVYIVGVYVCIYVFKQYSYQIDAPFLDAAYSHSVQGKQARHTLLEWLTSNPLFLNAALIMTYGGRCYDRTMVIPSQSGFLLNGMEGMGVIWYEDVLEQTLEGGKFTRGVLPLGMDKQTL